MQPAVKVRGGSGELSSCFDFAPCWNLSLVWSLLSQCCCTVRQTGAKCKSSTAKLVLELSRTFTLNSHNGIHRKIIWNSLTQYICRHKEIVLQNALRCWVQPGILNLRVKIPFRSMFFLRIFSSNNKILRQVKIYGVSCPRSGPSSLPRRHWYPVVLLQPKPAYSITILSHHLSYKHLIF